MRRMRPLALALGCCLLAGCKRAPAPEPPRAEQRHFRYERSLSIGPRPVAEKRAPRACVALDGTVFEHAAPTLADLRLYAGAAELPYVATISQAAAALPDAAKVLNLGERGGHIEFDLAMPQRAYTEIALDLNQTNFLASATVTGLHVAGETGGPLLGTFTLFDLSAQRLSRNTTLMLEESTFPFVHVELAVHGLAGAPALKASSAIIRGASVPPSREAQTVYTTVAETEAIAERERTSVAEFEVPVNVPVERVEFALAPGANANFSRTVHVTASPKGRGAEQGAPLQDNVSGQISRVRMKTSGQPIHGEQLGFAATLGTSSKAGTHVEVAVANGDDRPLALRSVKLAMRQRKLCFDVPEAAPLRLFYGDGALDLPIYDFARTYDASEPAAEAQLAEEKANPVFAPRPAEAVPVSERHPALLWVGLIAVVLVLGFIAFRSAKRLP